MSRVEKASSWSCIACVCLGKLFTYNFLKCTVYEESLQGNVSRWIFNVSITFDRAVLTLRQHVKYCFSFFVFLSFAFLFFFFFLLSFLM